MEKKTIGSILTVAGFLAALYGYVDLASFRSQLLTEFGVSNTFAHELIFVGAVIMVIGVVLLLAKDQSTTR